MKNLNPLLNRRHKTNSMKNFKKTAFIAIAFAIMSCNNNDISNKAEEDSLSLTHLPFSVERAEDWSGMFLRRHGWFGGDGIFATTANGVEKEGAAKESETIIWFSDTMFGDIVNDSLQSGYGMINNSVAYLQGGKPDIASIRFYWDQTPEGKPKSVFIPQTTATKEKEYYWLGDGFTNQEKNNDIYIFGYRISNIPGVAVFGFREEGNTLITIPANEKPPYKNMHQLDIPFFQNQPVDAVGSFGAGILVNTAKAGAPEPDGYMYIYGVRGKAKEVMVARVKPADIETFSEWRFWNGTDWTADVNNIKPIADRASNELSVTPLADGRYLMVFQKDGLGKFVGMRLGASPAGPFGPIIDVYDVSEDLKESKNLFPYNAKAHPVLSEPGELLISYNINSFDFDKDIKLFPNLYRPRFIRMKYQLGKE